MTSFALHRSGQSDVHLPGATLIEAIEANFEMIARQLGVGNYAGHHLAEVYVEKAEGWPGARLTITATGQDLAQRPANPDPRTTVGYIYAAPEQCPTERHYFDLRAR